MTSNGIGTMPREYNNNQIMTNKPVLTCLEAYNDMNQMLSQSKSNFIRNFSRCIQMGKGGSLATNTSTTTTTSTTRNDLDNKYNNNNNNNHHQKNNPFSSSEYYTIVTPLFPLRALQVYSAYNLGHEISQEDKFKYFSAHRGGSQGDYRENIRVKIDNVIDCLHKFPKSKRAVITIPNNSIPKHSSDDDAKCMREIHFYLDELTATTTSNNATAGLVLNATVWMRAQAAEIFPKNIHFVGTLMEEVVNGLNHEINSSSAGSDQVQQDVVVMGELHYLATTLISIRED